MTVLRATLVTTVSMVSSTPAQVDISALTTPLSLKCTQRSQETISMMELLSKLVEMVLIAQELLV